MSKKKNELTPEMKKAQVRLYARRALHQLNLAKDAADRGDANTANHRFNNAELNADRAESYNE